MTPDYETAARKATELLIERKISVAPIIPIPILKSMYPRVVLVTFADMAIDVHSDRDDIVMTFTEGQDAFTTVRRKDGELQYIIAYNMRLPFFMLQRGLARELGHIVLQHDGTKPESVRTEEAKCFARHLLCPRPVLMAVKNAGISLTTEVVGNITGCFERCIAGMQKTPGAHIPADLNLQVKAQFSAFISNFLDCQKTLGREDCSSLANFGTYMDNYEE
jgi:hypothetical protein